MSHATCSSCQKPIIWTITEGGKRMPVDAEPTGKATVLVRNPDDPGTPLWKQRDVYVSHFATCPQAAHHRKKSPAAEEPES